MWAGTGKLAAERCVVFLSEEPPGALREEGVVLCKGVPPPGGPGRALSSGSHGNRWSPARAWLPSLHRQSLLFPCGCFGLEALAGVWGGCGPGKFGRKRRGGLVHTRLGSGGTGRSLVSLCLPDPTASHPWAATDTPPVPLSRSEGPSRVSRHGMGTHFSATLVLVFPGAVVGAVVGQEPRSWL